MTIRVYCLNIVYFHEGFIALTKKKQVYIVAVNHEYKEKESYSIKSV